MEWAFAHGLEIIVSVLLMISCVLMSLLLADLNDIKRELQWSNATNTPRDGFPEHMEACWEDIGEHGRFLSDLGGMSVAMREQMFEEFVKALNKPITGAPKAGSIADVIHDLDRWLTQEAKYENIEGSQQD